MTDAGRCDALMCLSRHQLERLQIHARYLREFVNRNARTLPLRGIRSVSICAGSVSIRLTEDVTTFTLYASAQNLEELFRRVNNAFVGLLTLDFRPENRTFLDYIRANVLRLQCRIRVFNVLRVAGSIDYAVVDFLGRCTRPRAFSLTNDYAPEDYVMLFTHVAMRGSVSHLEYHFHDAPAPVYIIAELLRHGVIESCAISLRVSPRPWIARFIREFGEITCHDAGTVRDVALVFSRDGGMVPFQNIPTELLASLGTDVTAPECAFIEDWCRRANVDDPDAFIVGSPIAKRFTFVNSAAKRILLVFEWTLEGWFESAHRAYLLQISDM